MYALILFACLSDPSYQTREFAEAELNRLVDGWPWEYGPRIRDWTRQTGCPEAARRGGRITANYDRWRVNSYVPSTVPVWPICDAYPFPTAWGDVRDKRTGMQWYDGCGRCECEGGPQWWRYRRATERMARELIRDGASYAEVDALLSRMWKLEQAAKGDCGARWEREAAGWVRWMGGYPPP